MKSEEIGIYLRELRLNERLTQRQLAKQLHITHQAVSSWEKGKTLPDITTLSLLGDFYGITIDNLLLKKSSEEIAEEYKKSMIFRRILAFIGLVISIICISMFFNYASHFATHITFTVLLLVVSLVYSFLLPQRKRIIEYVIITGFLVIITMNIFLSNPRYYMLDETVFLEMTDKIEIIYPREFDEMTEAVQYHYIFDSYALIYTEGDYDIDIFNLSNYYEGEYITIDTGNMKIYDLIVMDELIYFSSYNEDIPGEFKLYSLDFETKEYNLLYESNEVLNMYKAFEQLFLITDPRLEPYTKIYAYNFDNNTVSEAITVDFSIYGMSEYFVDYNAYYILSVTNLNPNDQINTIGLFDYDFELQHTLYEEEQAVIHHLYSGYGKTLIGTDDGAIYFKDLSYEVISEGYARYPEVLSREYIRIGEKMYYEDFDSEEIELASNVLFYDSEYYPQGAKILIEDESGNFYAIDNELIGFVHFTPYVIEEVLFPNHIRVIYLVVGIITYGFFITLGHKRKIITNQTINY